MNNVKFTSRKGVHDGDMVDMANKLGRFLKWGAYQKELLNNPWDP